MSDINTPADPSTAISFQTAKRIVIVLSALIILSLIGLVVGAIWKLSGHRAPVPGAARDAGVAYELPAGAEVVTMETQPGRIILHVRSKGGEEVDILDTDDGRLIAKIRSAGK